MTSATPPEPSEDALVNTFGRLLEVFSSLEKDLGASLERDGGMSLSWFEVLLRLDRSGGQLPMGELAGQVALTTGGITRMLDRMVDVGYAERVPCPTDRRVTFAAITARGRRALSKAMPAHRAALHERLGILPARDLASLDRILDKLRP